MLFGAGSLVLVTKDLALNGSIRGEDLIFPPCLSQFELSADVNFLEAECLIDGRIQVVAGQINREVFTLSVTSQFADWQTMQFAYDELAQESSNVTIPILKVATIPATAPYEITDSDITATSAADIKAYIANRGTWGDKRFLKVVQAPAPATAEAASVDGANNKIVYDSTYAGAVTNYLVNRTYSSIETVGVETESDQFGKLEFWGLAYGTEFPGQMLMRVPELGRINTPTLTISGDITELTVEFRASVPAGQRRPFQLYNLSNATI